MKFVTRILLIGLCFNAQSNDLSLCQIDDAVSHTPPTSLGEVQAKHYLQEKYVNQRALNQYTLIDSRLDRSNLIENALQMDIHHIQQKRFLKSKQLLVLAEPWRAYSLEREISRLRKKGYHALLLMGGSHRFNHLMHNGPQLIEMDASNTINALLYGPWVVIDVTLEQSFDTLVEGDVVKRGTEDWEKWLKDINRIVAMKQLNAPMTRLLIVSDDRKMRDSLLARISNKKSSMIYSMIASKEELEKAQRFYAGLHQKGKKQCGKG